MVTDRLAPTAARTTRLRPGPLALCCLGTLVIAGLGCVLGPVPIAPADILAGSLTPTEQAILFQLRLPRVVLGLLVGALLAGCGAAYQGVFRNPLADPYLLGAAAGAGLGAVLAIALGLGGASGLVGVPLFAFVGTMVAVALTYLLGGTGRAGGTASLILAGVAVAAFLGAVQTFVLQARTDQLQEVYAWLLGRLSIVGWTEVWVVLPYAVVSLTVIWLSRRVLDVLAVGDDESRLLGMNPGVVRLVLVIAASLGTAAAVSVGGLIGFIGLVVPHLVRLAVSVSYRVIVPLSVVAGGGVLVAADIVARMALAPAEIPIGVVTAFLGAPFFGLLLRRGRTT
ncbi:FecCD family ABC transporter permease [Propionibacteriaceae bacterium Y2011]|uniref:FecCD family ABC transporter permease n=1 Tax=Microlunatus sp. Y2014 TaxID=3418488 RepID=UPI003B46782E